MLSSFLTLLSFSTDNLICSTGESIMKFIVLTSIVFFSSAFAQAECNEAKIARDSIRAVALISNQSMITDLVGGCDSDLICEIWANYRNHGYADKYQIKVRECRVESFELIAKKLPVKD